MVPDGAHGYHWEYYHKEDPECLDQGAAESCTSSTPDQPRGREEENDSALELSVLDEDLPDIDILMRKLMSD